MRHDAPHSLCEMVQSKARREREYRDFWADVGTTFPDLRGARSTLQYLEDEQWLWRTHLAPLDGLRVLKTDLWGMSRALLKLSGSLVHDYATISDDSPSPNRASRARRAATSAGIS